VSRWYFYASVEIGAAQLASRNRKPSPWPAKVMEICQPDYHAHAGLRVLQIAGSRIIRNTEYNPNVVEDEYIAWNSRRCLGDRCGWGGI
jgi:hypothetical protein